MIDFHCHILPGIDDGAQNWEDAQELARQAVSDGITHVVATPHGAFNGLATQLAKRDVLIRQLEQKLAEEQLPLNIVPGLEYNADGHSVNAALELPSCLCGLPGIASRPMLLELPFDVELSFAANVLFKAQLKNIPLVLAHPERYDGFVKKNEMLRDLMDKGLYLQFNAGGFKGSFFSNSIPKAMLKLMEHAPEHVLVGSDAHSPKLRPAGFGQARKIIVASLGEKAWNLISRTNPAKLLGIAL